MAFRVGRTSEDLKRELTDIIRYVKDPRVSSILTIIKVELSNDLSHCKVYISSLEGMEKAKETAKEPEYKKVPLTPEEEAYLNEYLENLPVIADIDLDVLFEQLSKGEQSAVQTLASYYMKATAELAADMNAKEILLADLIQEANLSLIQALDNAGEELRDEEWLLAEVRKGILQVIEEQTQVKFADDSLVARVEKLESAVRELNDDEDDKNAFSIDELAIILDMKVDEIRDILRLTGDDK